MYVPLIEDTHLGLMQQLKMEVVHIIVEKVNKLLVCPHMIVMPRCIKKVKSDYHVEIKLLYHC